MIEGTDAADPGPGDWVEYEFEGQPVKLDRRPLARPPYHLRLDWQLWFAAMAPTPRRHPWFRTLLARLLEGDGDALALVATDPYPDDPPRWVRAVRYRFTSPGERAETGDWWRRERVGTYVRPVSADDLRSGGRRVRRRPR